MRAREWYGWHFPEMARILNDNETFCRVVLKMGDRTKCVSTDFTGIMEVRQKEEEERESEGNSISHRCFCCRRTLLLL